MDRSVKIGVVAGTVICVTLIVLFIVSLGYDESDTYTVEFVDLETNKVFLTIDDVVTHSERREDGHLVRYYTLSDDDRMFVAVSHNRTFTVRKKAK